MLYFSSVNGKVYICKIHKFYYDTPPTNKTMAVRSAKCHFVSEQQLISSITRNGYFLIIVKKHDMLMLVTSIQTASSKCPPTAFLFARLDPFAERQYCCINLGLETSQLRSLEQRSSPPYKCWSALACNIGTRQALHPIRDIPVD